MRPVPPSPEQNAASSHASARPRRELLRPFKRVPRLYYSNSAIPRDLSGRERLAGVLFAALLALSYALFLLGGLAGYLTRQMYGMLIFAFLGYGLGVWMRRSLGLRGRNSTTGFFHRLRERANGARAGFLEWLVEWAGGKVLTREQCRAVVQVYDQAVLRLKSAKTQAEQNKILADLDARVHRMLSQ